MTLSTFNFCYDCMRDAYCCYTQQQAAGGCLWIKGGGPALTDEEAALPWSAFGLDMTGEARLRYHAAQVYIIRACVERNPEIVKATTEL
jgi:hypothetical protein